MSYNPRTQELRHTYKEGGPKALGAAEFAVEALLYEQGLGIYDGDPKLIGDSQLSDLTPGDGARSHKETATASLPSDPRATEAHIVDLIDGTAPEQRFPREEPSLARLGCSCRGQYALSPMDLE